MSQKPSRRERKNKRKNKNRTLKWIIWSISLLFIGVIAYYGVSIAKFTQDIHQPEDSRFKQFYVNKEKKKTEETIPKWEGKDRVNILLLGGDDRGLRANEVPRSDTMMLVTIDPVTKRTHLLSILRDTHVDIPGYRSNRINTALALGGPELAMETVSQLLDLPVQYYIYVDFQGFIGLIDAIGGVEFYVEKDMYYTSRADGPEYDINLKKGLQMLDGNKALQYVRFRYDARGDYARTERQRELIKAVAQKMQSTTSLIRLPKILESIQPYIETNLTLTDMLKLGSLAFDIRNEKIESLQVPPQEMIREANIGGASVLTVDAEKLRTFLHEELTKEIEEEENIAETPSEEESSAPVAQR